MSYPYPFKNYKHDVLERLRIRSKKMDNGCIEWTGGKQKQGYGQMTITLEKHKSKTALCHRILWEFTNDVELGRKIYVCHKCDNPACINIAHLYVGTAKKNSEDMVAKGRSTKGRVVPMEQRQFGIKRKLHTRIHKFTNEQISAIKSAKGKLKWIAEEFGTTTSYVSKLRNGKAKTLVEPSPDEINVYDKNKREMFHSFRESSSQ